VAFDALRNVHESYYPKAGKWKEDNGAFVNVIPADASAEDIAKSVNGAGVSLALVDTFSARNLVIEADLTYEGHSAPGLVFRVQEDKDVVSAMYMVVLNSDGVFLWRLLDKKWQVLGRYVTPVPAGAHHVRVEARDAAFRVSLDGKRVLEETHTNLDRSGGAGISARDGNCRIANLHVKALSNS